MNWQSKCLNCTENSKGLDASIQKTKDNLAADGGENLQPVNTGPFLTGDEIKISRS